MNDVHDNNGQAQWRTWKEALSFLQAKHRQVNAELRGDDVYPQDLAEDMFDTISDIVANCPVDDLKVLAHSPPGQALLNVAGLVYYCGGRDWLKGLRVALQRNKNPLELFERALASDKEKNAKEDVGELVHTMKHVLEKLVREQEKTMNILKRLIEFKNEKE